MNVFHCCVYKTASQWIKAIFSDPRIIEASGLTLYDYETQAFETIGPQTPHDKVFPDELPCDTIITPLYISYPAFKRINKSKPYKAFFVTRDPRDIVVSWYYSMKYSHKVIADYIAKEREHFNSISTKEGLRESIYKTADFLNAMGSWVDAPSQDENILLIKYEDLIKKDNLGLFSHLFGHCGIQIPEDILSAVLRDYSFEGITGRKRGLQDDQSHFRKGIEGDWINFFDDDLLTELQGVLGDLPEQLGYKTRDELTKQHLSFYQRLSSEVFSEMNLTKDELLSVRGELSTARGELSAARQEVSTLQAQLAMSNEQLLQARKDLELSNVRLCRKISALKQIRGNVIA